MNLPDRDRLPSPPIVSLANASFFFDLDGTLIDLIDRPEAVLVDDQLRRLLLELGNALDGRIAIVSGRSLAQLDKILGEIASSLAISGSHGCEHRWKGVSAQPRRPSTLDIAATELRKFVKAHPGTLLEEKSFGIALHYRAEPDAAVEVRAVVAELAVRLGLAMQGGKMVVELRVPGGDKGAAVRGMMARAPMCGTRPIFVGDDATDEHGFEAANAAGGYGVLIGSPRPTAASYGLSNPSALHKWLRVVLK